MKHFSKFGAFLVLISFLALSCSDDDNNATVDVSGFISQMTTVRDEMVELRDNAQYGDKKDMYPQESKYILDDAVIQIEKTIRFFKNGTETEPNQEKTDKAINEANKAIDEFKVTRHAEDLPSEEKSSELYVNGRAGGYIDFGHSPNYSNFGESGQQAFTVELWFKLKYTEGFGSIISCFNEDGETQTRKGWIINNFDNARVRMTLGLDNWGLTEPGVNFSSTEQWAHFAAVIDENGVDGDVKDGKRVIVKLYLNGELKDQSTAQDGKNYLSNYLETSMVAFGQPAGVGGMTDAWRLSGYIKDFHIWKSAKSEVDINKIMNKEFTVTGSEADLVCGWEFTTTAENNEDIKDLTGKYSAKLVGEYQWIPID